MLENSLNWFFQPTNPFLYWFVTYIFGPAFVMGDWGLVAMGLAHLLPFGLILKRKWQRLKAVSLLRRIGSLMGIFLLIHLAIGLLFWFLLPLLGNLFYLP